MGGGGGEAVTVIELGGLPDAAQVCGFVLDT